MPTWIDHLAGRFIVFDGPDGSGKSTQFGRFLDRCRAARVDVCEVRDPGGTAIGEQIRRTLLDPDNSGMSVRCEMLLYMASRAQLVEEVIRPALDAGRLVLADRFVSSTLAYQGTGGGLTADEIHAVARVAVGALRPDQTVIFDVDETVALSRLGAKRDRMEQKDAAFHRRVRAGFLAQAAADPARHLVVDAAPEADAVTEALSGALEAWVEHR